MTTRIVIVDDHPLFRGALGQALSSAIEAAEVVEAGSLDELIDRVREAIALCLEVEESANVRKHDHANAVWPFGPGGEGGEFRSVAGREHHILRI